MKMLHHPKITHWICPSLVAIARSRQCLWSFYNQPCLLGSEHNKKDGRNGAFVIGNDHFPASLLDLPCIVESYKTYDDNVLIKTADIGQIIMVREEGDAAPDDVGYRHGLTPPMRDARRRRFRREPDLNPELVQRVEKDLVNIMSGGTVENVDVGPVEHEGADDNVRNAAKKTKIAPAPAPAPKPDVPGAVNAAGEPERSESDDSDDSL